MRLDSVDDERRESLRKLRAHYAAARPHGSPHEAHANLEWVLGTKGDIGADAYPFDPKSVEVASLWLEDLASELEAALAASHEEVREDRRSMAWRLRDATASFLLAFRSVTAHE